MSERERLIKYPKLIKEWNYEKNGSLSPLEMTAESGKKVWWICSKGHEWEAVIGDRTKGNGCPVCSGKKVLAGYNDLATTAPELALEWNYEKNDDMPQEITANSNKKRWWKCEKGHEWFAIVANRNKGRGCPFCGGQQVLVI